MIYIVGELQHSLSRLVLEGRVHEEETKLVSFRVAYSVFAKSRPSDVEQLHCALSGIGDEVLNINLHHPKPEMILSKLQQRHTARFEAERVETFDVTNEDVCKQRLTL